MTFDELMQTLRDRAADLSPQLQRAAMLLESNRSDIALLSMRDLARRCARCASATCASRPTALPGA